MTILRGLRKTGNLAVLGLAVSSLLFAVETHVWQQDEASEFLGGTIKNLSVRSDGQVSLAPSFREVADTGTPYLWAIAEDSKGTVYLAGGAPTGATTKIFAVAPGGTLRTYATLNGLEIHALAVNAAGDLFAATSPDAKVYRVRANGQPELFFDTHAKYVWSLLFDPAGKLYVATGDQGVIYSVTPDGKGTEFFRTDETHARSMVFDSKGNLLVGTDPGGYLLRISPSGKSFVLFQSPQREISALTVHGDTIYAAAVGAGSAIALPAPLPPPAGPPPGTNPAVQQQQQAAAAAPAPALQSAPITFGGGSELYKIESDGESAKVWSSSSEVIYAVTTDPDGRPLIGTGNRGMIYRVDTPTLFTQLVNAPPNQITALLPGNDHSLYVATGNVGKLYKLGPAVEKSGYLESRVLDARILSQWGKVHVLSNLNGGHVDVATRSGNVNRPQKNWSDWSTLSLSKVGGAMQSPAARFLQYKLTLTASASQASPSVSAVQLAFLPKNIAPSVTDVQVEDANYRTSSSSNSLERNVSPAGSPLSVSLPALGTASKPSGDFSDLSSGVTLQYAKGFITVRWNARDENRDTLWYKVEIQGKDEHVWRVLADHVLEHYFSFDGVSFADGTYRIRVTASDEPSNAPGTALSGSLDSDSFTVDNTPPVLAAGAQSVQGGQHLIRFSAKDAQNWIDKAEYSVNGEKWLLLPPVGQLSDSEELNYELRLPAQPGGPERVVTVRVFDDNENQSVIRFIVPASR